MTQYTLQLTSQTGEEKRTVSEAELAEDVQAFREQVTPGGAVTLLTEKHSDSGLLLIIGSVRGDVTAFQTLHATRQR